MNVKLEKNPNDDVNQTVETSVNAGINEQNMAALDKISKLQDSQLQLSGDTERAKIEVFRLQFGCHGGSNVFFNRNGEDCRYSLIDGIGVRLENGKYPTLRAYPNSILFQTMMPQAKCNMAS